MLTVWRVPLVLVAVVAAVLSGCAGASGQADVPAEAASGLPVAAAPSDAGTAPPASETAPVWTEPGDPVEAYRELTDKVTYLRSRPSLDLIDEIYARNTPIMRSQRRQVKKMIKAGFRVVDGRTVLEDVMLLGKDDDTAVLEVRGRQEPSTTVDARGRRREIPELCQTFEVELRNGGDGWRVAALTAGEDERSWRCDE